MPKDIVTKAMEIITSWLKSKNDLKGLPPFLSLLKTDLQKSIVSRVAEHFEVLKPSYSEGLQILEWATEIVLMNSDEDLFQNSQSTESWLIQLKKLRYPLTTQRDSTLENKMLSWPWPYGSKVRFERRGDRSGVELKIYLTSEADLIKAIASLERVKMEFKNESTSRV